MREGGGEGGGAVCSKVEEERGLGWVDVCNVLGCEDETCVGVVAAFPGRLAIKVLPSPSQVFGVTVQTQADRRRLLRGPRVVRLGSK